MGNLQSSSLSCFQFQIGDRRRNNSAWLFDGKGNLLRRVDLPLRAAELMLEEAPGHVISPAANLRRTRRFSAAKAEDELVAGDSYVLIPLSRLNCRASEAEMVALESATKKRSKRKSSSRVSPAMAEGNSKEEGEDDLGNRVLDHDISDGVSDLGFACRQKGYCRGWAPALATIAETSSRF